MTIAEVFRAIGDTPVLGAAIFIVGIPLILWFFRDWLKWILFGRKGP